MVTMRGTICRLVRFRTGNGRWLCRRAENCLRMAERSDSPETKTVLWVMAREDIERVSVKAVRAERCDEQ